MEKAIKLQEDTETNEMHEKAFKAQKKISDSNRAAWTIESEVAKNFRAEQLKEQIEGLKRDINEEAFAEAKAIEAERLKQKEPGDFICPDGESI